MPKITPKYKSRTLLLVLVCLSFSLPAKPAQLEPAVATQSQEANLPTQPISANDLITVSVYKTPELTGTERVSSDGFIHMPMLKQGVKVLGLMPGEIESAVAQALRGDHILVDPLVTVTVVEYDSHPISVIGAVRQPVTFQANVPVTLLDALTRAGGLAPEAGPEILVSRTQSGTDATATPTALRILVKDFISGDPAANIVLNGGEQVRVPEGGKVYVVGNIKMPGSYPIGGDTEFSVLKVLALSQGLSQYSAKEAYIYRQEGGHKSEIPIPLNKMMERKAPDAPLLANDILYVPDRKGRRLAVGTVARILLIAGGSATALIYTLR